MAIRGHYQAISPIQQKGNSTMISPILQERAQAMLSEGYYTVVTIAYSGACRSWRHSTLKASFRRLGSACAGKLKRNGDYAAFIVTPCGALLNYNEAKESLL
jgi:hypothetical protein